MSRTEPQKNIWREEDVEAVLRDFFRAEMPAELRNLTPRPVSGSPAVRVTATDAPRVKGRTGRFSLAIVAVTLCVTFGLVLSSTRPEPGFRDEIAVTTPAPVSPVRAVPAVVAPAQLVPEVAIAAAPTKPEKLSRPATDPILNGRNSWHPSVIPVELRKYAPGLLIHSGALQRKADQGALLKGDIEHHGFPKDEEEGSPASPIRSKTPAKKN